jgi:hypothetical protein
MLGWAGVYPGQVTWKSKHNIDNEIKIRFEVSMAGTMKNAVFWDIKPQFTPHRRHIMSPLQSSAG